MTHVIVSHKMERMLRFKSQWGCVSF